LGGDMEIIQKVGVPFFKEALIAAYNVSEVMKKI
jgi:hypothetical protein